MDMVQNFNAFRLGDVRGIYPDDINETFVESFAHALVGEFGLQGKIATGRDMRPSSEPLQDTLNQALASIGIDVINIGLCPTELGYFASGQAGINAAIVVTASHNPARYNGLKIVLSNGRAITLDNGLSAVRKRMEDGYRHPGARGSIQRHDYHRPYLEFLERRFPASSLGRAKIALNGLNGTASTMAGMIATELDLSVTWFRKNPGPIPVEGAGPANPVLAAEMKHFMRDQDYTLGVAWDGDCDRCVCFDEYGDLVPAYYLIGLLTESFLAEAPGAAIVFDTKLCWNTLDIIRQYGGVAVPAATGHAFMKQMMHAHGAIYGGELSSHHYFGDFWGCDSGMFAWLTVLKLLSTRGTRIQELVAARREAINCTPEITLVLDDAELAFETLLNHVRDRARSVDHFDGLSVEMPGNWRFSLRKSKTEPVIRLNFEARNAPDTLVNEGAKVLDLLEPFRSDDSDWLKGLYIQ